MDQDIKKLDSIQIMRFLACLMVLVFHFLTISKKYDKLPDDLTADFLKRGVDSFFFISGFIMVYIQGENISARKFLFKRIKRICPVYYEFTIIALIIWSFNPSLFNNAVNNRTDIIASLLLIPAKNGYMHLINVAWTLSYEVWFYSVFALFLVLFRKNYIVGLLLYGLFVAIFNLFHLELDNRFFNLITSPLIIEFIIGTLYCYYTKNKNKKYLMATLISFLFLVKIDHILAIPIIASIALFELLQLCNKYFVFPRIFVLIGDASYTLYLTHIIVMTVTAVVWSKCDNLLNLPDILWFICLPFTSILFSLFHYVFIEKQLSVKIRKKTISLFQIN